MSVASAEVMRRTSAMSILAPEGIASLAADITPMVSIARITVHHTLGLTPATTERLPIRKSPRAAFASTGWFTLGELARVRRQFSWVGRHSPE